MYLIMLSIYIPHKLPLFFLANLTKINKVVKIFFSFNLIVSKGLQKPVSGHRYQKLVLPCVKGDT